MLDDLSNDQRVGIVIKENETYQGIILGMSVNVPNIKDYTVMCFDQIHRYGLTYLLELERNIINIGRSRAIDLHDYGDHPCKMNVALNIIQFDLIASGE